MTVEEWSPIPGFPDYRASSLGRIAPVEGSGQSLSGGGLSAGRYWAVRVQREDGRRVTQTVHSLVAAAFYGPRPPGNEVRHLDGDSLNNRADNLAWGTPSENAYDRVRHGTHNEATKTHCARQHPLVADNVYTQPGTNKRACRTCRRENGRALKQRRRPALAS